MLHAYCIRRAADPAPPDGLTGIAGAEVRLVEAGTLGVWYSEGTAPASVEQLRTHDMVIREAMRTRTALPLRFGTTFRDPEAAVGAVLEREEEFGAVLQRLGQRVEMGMRISRRATVTAAEGDRDRGRSHPKAATPASAGRGRAFLEGRRQALRQEADAREEAAHTLAALSAELSGLDAPCIRTPMADGEVIGLLAHLVHRAEVTTYRRRGEALQRSHPELRIVVTGPWAPYSFVAPEQDGEASA